MIAVGQLASGVAHEIRNPLGLIRNYCYVLKTTDDINMRNKAISIIEKSVERSGNIITNLLDFSRQSDMNIEEVMIREHINSVLNINEGLLKKKNIKIDFKKDNDFKVKLCVESFDMIFINLISNAVDAIKNRGIITIKLRKAEESFFLKFEDTGCGMDEDTIKNAFNPFFTTKKGKEGNGLGLYIVYNEIGKMNGTVEIESEIGEGTEFNIRLPIVGGES